MAEAMARPCSRPLGGSSYKRTRAHLLGGAEATSRKGDSFPSGPRRLVHFGLWPPLVHFLSVRPVACSTNTQHGAR